MDVETETSEYGDNRRGGPGEPPLRDAHEHANARQEYAVQVKRASEKHSGCPGRPGYDPELGVVCYCGETIGQIHPDDIIDPPARALASQTTAAALEAVPLVTEPIDEQVVSESGLASAVSPADPILARIDVIDPTGVYDSRMVEEHLLDVVARLERGAHYERVCAEDVYDKTMRYDFALKRATLKARDAVGGGDVNERKAWAELQIEAEYVALMIAKMKADAIKSTMHSLRSVQSAYQSIAKSIGSTYSATRNDNPKF